MGAFSFLLHCGHWISTIPAEDAAGASAAGGLATFVAGARVGAGSAGICTGALHAGQLTRRPANDSGAFSLLAHFGQTMTCSMNPTHGEAEKCSGNLPIQDNLPARLPQREVNHLSAAWYAIVPPTIVSLMRAVEISCGVIENKLRSTTTMSANIPGLSAPREASLNPAYAAPVV